MFVRDHFLFFFEQLQRAQTVAQSGGALVFLCLGGSQHIFFDDLRRVADIAVEDGFCPTDEVAVVFGTHLTGTGGDAPAHIAEQAGTLAPDVAGERTLAHREGKNLRHRLEGGVRARRPLVRTVIARPVALAFSRDEEFRIFFVCYLDIRIGFCVFEFDVVFRRVLFDQDVLKGQCLDLRVA